MTLEHPYFSKFQSGEEIRHLIASKGTPLVFEHSHTAAVAPSLGLLCFQQTKMIWLCLHVFLSGLLRVLQCGLYVVGQEQACSSRDYRRVQKTGNVRAVSARLLLGKGNAYNYIPVVDTARPTHVFRRHFFRKRTQRTAFSSKMQRRKFSCRVWRRCRLRWVVQG